MKLDDCTEAQRRFRFAPRDAAQTEAAVLDLIARGYEPLTVAHALGLRLGEVERMIGADGCMGGE